MNKSKVTVFLDMDGVLVDWLNGIRKFFGKPTEFYDCFRADPTTLNHSAINEMYGGREVFEKIHSERPEEWWLDLEFFPWADYLVKAVSTDFNTAFLTSPGHCPNSAKAKLIWQAKHYPNIPMLIGKHKYLAAGFGKILIDDDDWQLTRFDNAGGLALKWPNQFEFEKLDINLTRKYIDEMIRIIWKYQGT